MHPNSMPARDAAVAGSKTPAPLPTGTTTEADPTQLPPVAPAPILDASPYVLPSEDAAAVQASWTALYHQFGPTTTIGRMMVEQIAMATLRTDRITRFIRAETAYRVRLAVDAWQEARHVVADEAMTRLRAGDGRSARPTLLATPEGIDRLMADLMGLRGCLDRSPVRWSREHGLRLDACLGVVADALIPSRVEALTAAFLGSDKLLTTRDHAEMARTKAELPAHAVAALLGVIDRELKSLRNDSDNLSRERIAADRAAVAARAQTSPCPAVQAAREHQKTITADMARAVRLFHKVEGRPAAKVKPIKNSVVGSPKS